jgi:hypothetical protein
LTGDDPRRVLTGAPFEIEFRCRFESEEEAFAVLPFLRPSLRREVGWTDTYYGLDIFRRGEVLRLASVVFAGDTRYFLGWKGPDAGSFANLRQELNEEVPEGITGSAILAAFAGRDDRVERDQIGPALEAAGHTRFMSYAGRSLTGRDERLALNTKVMHCEILRWPLLVELEKLAPSESEARRYEQDLLALCREYWLDDRLVPEEPGTLLYETTGVG